MSAESASFLESPGAMFHCEVLKNCAVGVEGHFLHSFLDLYCSLVFFFLGGRDATPLPPPSAGLNVKLSQ